MPPWEPRSRSRRCVCVLITAAVVLAGFGSTSAHAFTPGSSSVSVQPTASPRGALFLADPCRAASLTAGIGVMGVVPTSVLATRDTTLTFTYTVSPCPLTDAHIVDIAIPADWTPPSTATAGPGSVSYVGPGIESVVSGQIQVSTTSPVPSQGSATSPVPSDAPTTSTVPPGVGLTGPTLTDSFTVTYEGIAPAVAEVSTFTASEGPGGDTAAAELSVSPTVNVTSPVTASPGHGAVTVSPHSLKVAGSGPLTFTYIAGRGGFPASGTVVIVVPPGWAAPSRAKGDPGFVRIPGGRPGQITVQARRIVVSGVRLRAGQAVTIRYGHHARIAPDIAGVSLFQATDQISSAAVPFALTAQPVTVVARAANPLSRAWLVVIVVVLLAALGAILTTARRLRRHRTPSGKPQVRPHPGTSGEVTITIAATSPSVTVRIVAHQGTATTTLKRDDDDVT